MEQRSLISSCMEDTANKKPSKECKTPPMVARLLTGLFLFCCGVIKRKKEKVCIFQDRKILRGMLIFVVADIWNWYNTGMKKTTNYEFGGIL